jgi:hypothetical protein
MIDHQLATALCAGSIVAVVVGGAALTAPVAQAARISSDEKFVLKETTAACKSEAKEKKIRWPTSGKYVSDCVAKPVKLTPAELQKITDKRATVACKAEAKGKKIRWPASRKYVLHYNGSQRASHHQHRRIAQRAEYEVFAGATTSRMGM